MKSKYDSIKTARELIEEVAFHGISTKEEDICRAQDIFGHSTVSELSALARSKEEFGNQSIRSLFYFIAFKIWGWEDAVQFWNETSNIDYENAKKLRKEVEDLKRTISARDKLIKSMEDSRNYDREKRAELEEENRKLREEHQESRLENAGNEMEVQRLKAKLFDMMEAMEKRGA